MVNLLRFMSSPQWHWYLIASWIAGAALVFIGVGGWTERSWLLLCVIAALPPAMMLWFWNEDRPLIMERIRMRQKTQPSSPNVVRAGSVPQPRLIATAQPWPLRAYRGGNG
jgi:hypothetical protein